VIKKSRTIETLFGKSKRGTIRQKRTGGGVCFGGGRSIKIPLNPSNPDRNTIGYTEKTGGGTKKDEEGPEAKGKRVSITKRRKQGKKKQGGPALGFQKGS